MKNFLKKVAQVLNFRIKKYFFAKKEIIIKFHIFSSQSCTYCLKDMETVFNVVFIRESMSSAKFLPKRTYKQIIVFL